MTVMEGGTEFAGYRIDRLLGAGGFCNVYLAEDMRPALRRKVALKVLNPTLSADDKNRERFQRESLLAVELDDHPNIVGVLDAGDHEGQLYIAQRYIEGHDLGHQIEQDGPLSAERAVEVLTEVAAALDYAHEAGLVHRDVKPRNILIRERDQRCFLADFGLTKRTASSDSLTGAGEFLGTFAYAAPEQLGGSDVDGRADLYALGCVLYESLTGEPPFGGDIHSMITSHLTKPPPRPSEARADLAPAIDAVVDKAMAKEPDDRYQTGNDFAEAARRALLGSNLPPPVPPPPPTTTTESSGQTVSAPLPPLPPTTGQVPKPGYVSTGGLPPATVGGPPKADGTGSSRTPLLVGGALLLIVIVVGAILLLGGGDDGGGDDPGGDDPSEEEQALEEAEEAAEEAFDELPSALRDSCELGDVEDNSRGVVAIAACEPDDGADDVEVVVYEDEDDVAEDFDEALDAAAETPDNNADCASDSYAVHSWTTEDDPEGTVGQVACWLTDDDTAGLAWTDADLRSLAVATRDDNSDLSLYEWWAELVDRQPPEVSDEFPTPDETELLTHVPEAIAPSCVRSEVVIEEAVARVQCTPEDMAAVLVYYTQFATAEEAGDAYTADLGVAGVPRNTGEGDVCPLELRVTSDGEPTGRVFCQVGSDGFEYLEWTDRELAIVTTAYIAGGFDVGDLWDWWRTEAGPF